MKYLKQLKNIYFIILGVFVLTFIISASLAYYTPYSARASIEYSLYPIYSEVDGKITEILIDDGEWVESGTPLFKVDDKKLKLKLEELTYQYKNQENQLKAMDYKIMEAKKQLLEAKITLHYTKINYVRYKELYLEELIAKVEFEDWQLKYKLSQKKVEAAEFVVNSLIEKRGKKSSDNEILKSIKTQIQLVKKDLKDTVVRSHFSGYLSMHQLFKGQMVNTSTSYGYIYNKDNLNIYVDYMEKSLNNFKSGQEALIIFDSVPGKIFKGSIDKTVSIMQSGYTSPDKLYTIEKDTRWIRASGRVRVKIVLNEELSEDINISSGSKGAVTIINSNHKVLSKIAWIWIKLMSFANYIY